MRCEEARRLMASRRELPYAHERTLHDHLGTCERCRVAHQREERAMQALRQVVSHSATLPVATTQVIRARLADVSRISGKYYVWVGGIIVTAVLLLWLATTSGPIGETLSQVGLLPQTTVGAEVSASSTLYIASSVPPVDSSQKVSERVTALDLASGRERYRVEDADELSLAPDGSALYVAGRFRDDPLGGDSIRALDPRTGRERWRVPVAFRAAYPGQQNLLVSPDGRWLYVRSYDVTRGSGDAMTVPFWLQIIDARSGQVQAAQIALPSSTQCGAPQLVSPSTGRYAYLACYWGTIVVLNTATQQLENRLPADVSGAVLFPDAEHLWIVSARPWVVSQGMPAETQLRELAPADLRVLRTLSLHVAQPFAATDRPVTWIGSAGRLVGVQVVQETPGTDTATVLLVFDPASGRQEASFRYERPLGNLVIDRAGKVLYATVSTFPQHDTTIVGLSVPNGTVRATFTRPGEQVNQLLLGP